MRLQAYRTVDIRLSDHRPVTAVYTSDVEVFCPKKLQRALTFTDAEVEDKFSFEEESTSGIFSFWLGWAPSTSGNLCNELRCFSEVSEELLFSHFIRYFQYPSYSQLASAIMYIPSTLCIWRPGRGMFFFFLALLLCASSDYEEFVRNNGLRDDLIL